MTSRRGPAPAEHDPRSRGHGPLRQAQGGRRGSSAARASTSRTSTCRASCGSTSSASPYAHATIKGIDASEALKVPGVAAVITGADLEKAGLALDADPRGRQADGAADRRRCMYQSQEVAAVVATSRYAAADGVAAVMVDYEPLQVVVDPRRRCEPGAPVLRPDRGEDKQTNHIWHWEWGDKAAADAALANADVNVVRGHLHPAHPRRLDRDVRLRRRLGRHPRPAHAAHDDPGAARHPDACSPCVSGLPEQNIRVKTHDIGGGFGGKVPVYPGYVLAVVASLTTGKPVKWIEDRSREPPGRLVRSRLPHPRRAGRDEGRPDHRRSRSRPSPTTATPTPRPTRRSSRPACST